MYLLRAADLCGRELSADRRGFTFVELIVGLAIIVMIAATVTPVLTGSLDRTRIRQGAEMLAELSGGFSQFHEDVLDNPGRLSQLSTGISTTQRNSCGAFYPQGKVIKWLGPYYGDRTIMDGATIPVFIGNARDELVRLPLTQGGGSGNNALLGIAVDAVSLQDAIALDRQIDAGDGATSGTVHWDAPNSAGEVTLRYLTPINGC